MTARTKVSPDAKPRGRFHHGDLREALGATASAVVDADGHEALGLRDLARRLRVSQPALYRHFATKEDLLLEVAWRGYRRFDADVAAAAEGIDDPYEALRVLARAYVRHAQRYRGWFRLFFTRGALEAPIATGEATPQGGVAHVRIAEAIRRVVGPDAPEASVGDHFRSFWALTHGLAVLVTERVFQLVPTDAERIAAADAAIAAYVDTLRFRYAQTPSHRPRPRSRRSSR